MGGLLLAAPSHAVPADYPPSPGKGGGPGPSPTPLEPTERTGVLSVDGVRTNVKMKSEPAKGTIRITGSGIDVLITSVGPAGVVLPLGADGSLLIVQGGDLVVTGKGFEPTSTITLWLLSTPTRIGAPRTSATGAVNAAAPIPAGVAPGAHHAQAFGYALDGRTIRLTVPVRVLSRPLEPHSAQVSATAYFDPRSAGLSSEQEQLLDQLVDRLPAGARKLRVVVAGYVQPDATTANDLSLSSARALAVARYLKSRGVTARFSVSGRGISSAPGEQGRQAHVQVVLTVLR